MYGHPLGCWVSFATRRRERAVAFVAGTFFGAAVLAIVLELWP